METLWQDVKYAVRMLMKASGFTAVTVLTLALGIGANTVMFTVVNTVLLSPLPYRDSGELLLVQTVGITNHQPLGTAPPDFYTYRAQNHSFELLAAFYLRPRNLTGRQEPDRVPTLIVTSEFFSVLGVQPVLGRGFAPGDEQWGQQRVAVISDGLWRRRFGADPGMVGRTVHVNSEPYVVVGVLPPKFSFVGLTAQLFVPMSFAPGDNLNSHNNYFLTMVGRLKPGIQREQASSDLNSLSEAIIREHPENKGTAVDSTLLQEALVQGVRRAILVLMGVVGFVLLIACANIANLLLARAAGRQREIAIRAALGASRIRLLRQFLTESLVLAGLGAALGVGLAYWVVAPLNLLSQGVLPRAQEIRLDATVLVFACTIAIFTAVLFGLAPALHSMGLNLNDALKEGTRTAGETRSRRYLRSALVVAEVALSLALLIGAGLMVKSIHHLTQVEAGFDSRNVLTAQVSMPAQKYIDRRLERQFSRQAYVRSTQFLTDIVTRVRTLPRVRAAGFINGLPLMGEIWGKNVTFYDRPLPSNVRDLPPIQYRVVVGDYFRALGIRMLYGRAFTDRDALEAPPVAIVNREFVHRYWNDQDPIGKQISVNPPAQLVPVGTLPLDYGGPERFTVVGVADDVHYGSLQAAPLPVVYVPYAQGSEGEANMFLVMKTESDPAAMATALRQQVWQVDHDQPVASIQTMEARVSSTGAQPRMEAAVLGGFAGLAVLLAGIGIYGVMSYSVARRTREIGVRMALGARAGDVLRLVLGQGMLTAAIGVAIGIGGSFFLTRTMQSLLFGVSPTDPVTFAGVALLLTLVALLASYIPARRAARVDPMVALRYE